MNVFNKISETLKNLFGTNGNYWVIRKNTSPENLESCNGSANEDDISRTCALCVALNDTIFKNNNKPNFYHLYCKCKNITIDFIKPSLIFPIKKLQTIYLLMKIKKE